MEEEPASPTTRILHSPGLNCFILAVFGSKTRIDVETIKYGLTQTLIKHPRFCSKPVFDAQDATSSVGWVRTSVNIDDHIIVPNLDPNMDVENYLSRICDASMDLTKPLWELHILDAKISSEAISTGVFVFRFHHSLGDGVSLISLLLACARKSSDPDALPSLPAMKNNKETHTSTFLNSSNCFSALLMFFKVMWNTLVDQAQSMATVIYLKDTNMLVRDRVAIEHGPIRRFVYKMLSLDDVKFVKDAMRMTINDVLLGITQAGLSRYLNRKYGKDKGENSVQIDHLPKRISARALLTVNIRQNTTAEGVAKMMEEDVKERWDWGNHVGYVLLPLHLNIRDDPLDYIRDAKVNVDRKKQSFGAQLSYATRNLLIKIIGVRAAATATRKALLNTTLTFSNVVGPMDEISFYGHPIAFFAHWVYGLPQALSIHFQSYMKKMTVALTVDEDVIPDPHNLCDEIAASLILAKNAITRN